MSLSSSLFRGSEFFVLRGIQAATDQCTAKLCWERDSCIRQKGRLGDLNFPSILGFQILRLIETEVKVKSSIGLPSRAPALGFCFSTFVLAKPCYGADSKSTSQEGKLFLLGGCIPGIPKIPVPSPPHIVNIRFLWGGQKVHSPNHSCSQAPIWITQLILHQSSKPIWQELGWFRLTRSHCLGRRVTTSLLGEQNQVGEHKSKGLLAAEPEAAFPRFPS